MDVLTKPAHALVKIHGLSEPLRFDNTGFAIRRLTQEILLELADSRYRNRGGEIIIRISTDGPIKEAEEAKSEYDKSMDALRAAATYIPTQWENAYIDLFSADPLILEYKSLFSERGRAGKTPATMSSIKSHVESTYTVHQIWGDDHKEWPAWN